MKVGRTMLLLIVTWKMYIQGIYKEGCQACLVRAGHPKMALMSETMMHFAAGVRTPTACSPQ
jgi:hypothetical protein